MVDGNVLKRKLPVSNFLFTQVNISNSKYQMLYALANFQLENKKKTSSHTVPKAGKSFHRNGQENKQVNKLLFDGVNTSECVIKVS